MPLTAGFIAKFYVIVSGVNIKLWSLLIILIINSAIGLFYYLRIIISMYIKLSTENIDENDTATPAYSFSLLGTFSLFVLSFFLVYFGIAPGLLIQLIEKFTKF